jgi:hypothetical protein
MFRQIADFLTDFPNARMRAEDLDQKILASAKNVSDSDNLGDLASLATRTLMGSMDITYGSGDLNDIMIFVKSMGNPSNSTAAR